MMACFQLKHAQARNCTSMHIIGKVWSKPIRFSRYTSILLIYCMIHLFRIDMLACCSTAEEAHLLGVSLAKAHSHLIQRSQHVTCHNNNSRHIFLYFDVLHCFAAFWSTPLSTAQRKMTKTYETIKNSQKFQTKTPKQFSQLEVHWTWGIANMAGPPLRVLSSNMHAVASASTRARVHAWQVMQPSKLGMRQVIDHVGSMFPNSTVSIQ